MNTVSETVVIPDTVASLQPERPQPSIGPPVGTIWLELDDTSHVPDDIVSLKDQIAYLETGDEVADLLREYGAKGHRGVLGSCPISNFASACAPGIRVETNSDGIWVSVGDAISQQWKIFGLGITEFVKNFDNGLYPDLVE